MSLKVQGRNEFGVGREDNLNSMTLPPDSFISVNGMLWACLNVSSLCNNCYSANKNPEIVSFNLHRIHQALSWPKRLSLR